MELHQFLHWARELHGRHARRVVRALAAYGVVAAALVEVTEPVVHALHLPEWTLTFVVVSLALGFPVVAVLSWASAAPAEARIAGEAIGPGGVAEGAGAGVSSGWRRLSVRVAAILVAAGVLVAAPGLTWYLVNRARHGEAAGSVASRAPSIAVLSFTDLSAGKDQGYFADGIAEEILDALVHVDGLRVAGRTSSFSFRDRPATIPEIGRALSVATVLEGSVRKDGNRVRVTAELVDAAGGDQLWSQTYDRELTGIFAVQDEIARAVVDALKPKIMPGRGPALQRAHSTSPDAYNAYLLGKHFFDRGTPEDMRRAVRELEKAVALDPGYAPAWAWLSVSLLNAGVYLADPGAAGAAVEDAAARSIAAADRAVALAPDLAECWSARGWMRTSLSWDWAGARADFERALAIAPRDANILLRQSHLQSVLGHLPEAVATDRKVIDLDPLYAWGWEFLAGYELGSGRPDLARDAAQRAIEIAPGHVYATFSLGIAQVLLANPRRALDTFRNGKSEVIRLMGTAVAQHALGDRAEEEKALAALTSRFSETEPYLIAAAYAWRGDRDVAFEWLERAVAQRGGRGISRLLIRRVQYDPLLAKVRADPRYLAVLKKMGLP